MWGPAVENRKVQDRATLSNKQQIHWNYLEHRQIWALSMYIMSICSRIPLSGIANIHIEKHWHVTLYYRPIWKMHALQVFWSFKGSWLLKLVLHLKWKSLIEFWRILRNPRNSWFFNQVIKNWKIQKNDSMNFQKSSFLRCKYQKRIDPPPNHRLSELLIWLD